MIYVDTPSLALKIDDDFECVSSGSFRLNAESTRAHMEVNSLACSQQRTRKYFNMPIKGKIIGPDGLIGLPVQATDNPQVFRVQSKQSLKLVILESRTSLVK